MLATGFTVLNSSKRVRSRSSYNDTHPETFTLPRPSPPPFYVLPKYQILTYPIEWAMRSTVIPVFGSQFAVVLQVSEFKH